MSVKRHIAPPPSLHLTWPGPATYQLPFDAWRPGQLEAINTVMGSPTRVTALALPTGFGKSLVYMGLHAMSMGRTAVCTATRALQDQLTREFAALAGFAQIKGQSNYICGALQPGGELFHQFGATQTTYVDQAPCHLGVDCSRKAAGCGYFDAVRSAQHAEILVANYAWWLTLPNQPQIIVRPDRLVLDEAHDAPDALADALGATLSQELVPRVLGEKLPLASALDPVEWVQWAEQRRSKLAARLEGTVARSRDAVLALRRSQALLRELQRVSSMDPSLLVHRAESDGSIRFDVVWAAPLADKYLFQKAKQIVLVSATMTRHTCDLLGVIEKDLTFYEAGDGFPIRRRPVYLCFAKQDIWGEKPLRVDHRMTPAQQKELVEHIDRIIDARLDRKGIIHTTSYERRDLLFAHSRHVGRFVAHTRRDTQDVIQKFKTMPPESGAILVSPSVTTGYDFPYRDAEYQILMKIPFPDSRDPVVAARTIVDRRYASHVAMQTLVQTCGRPMRADDDQCETFIVDGHAKWFLGQHGDLAPRWFLRAVMRDLPVGQVPTPPRPLAPR